MEYIAIYNGPHINETYMGTLEIINMNMDADSNHPDSYTFYELGKEVEVDLEKKLTLVVKE